MTHGAGRARRRRQADPATLAPAELAPLADTVAALLGRAPGKSYVARCPGCSGIVGVTPQADGRLVLACVSGCSLATIRARAGLHGDRFVAPTSGPQSVAALRRWIAHAVAVIELMRDRGSPEGDAATAPAREALGAVVEQLRGVIGDLDANPYVPLATIMGGPIGQIVVPGVRTFLDALRAALPPREVRPAAVR